MAPSQFLVRLQRGINSGFTPADTDLLIFIINSDEGLELSGSKRPNGSRSLDPIPTKTLAIADHEALIDELHNILKTLPREQPPGSQDIYELDTSIMWTSDDLDWSNGGAQGVGNYKSSVQVNEEQKKKFRRALDIILEISGQA